MIGRSIVSINAALCKSVFNYFTEINMLTGKDGVLLTSVATYKGRMVAVKSVAKTNSLAKDDLYALKTVIIYVVL